MAARNSLCKKVVDLEAGTVAFAFTDAETVTFNIGDLDEKGLRRAALHGISQKGGDSYAGVKSVKEAQENLVKTLQAVEKGDWSTRVPGEPRITVLVSALARAAGKTEEEAKAVIETIKSNPDEEAGKFQLKALNSDPAIRKAKLEIAAEKLALEDEGPSVIGNLF